jgi:large subunit ribosomal protein L19
MKNIIKEFEQSQLKIIKEANGKSIAKFNVGDTVSVKYRINEGGTIRIQAFNGIVISRTKGENNYCATFTVRKISSSIGVERKFILYSPLIAGVELLKQGDVRRAKLYYLRKLTGKASRIKEKLDFTDHSQQSPAPVKE